MSINIIEYEAVIGLEIHAELDTRSKMFCTCRVVDSTMAQPNIAVCPVCAGMPGVLPVVNQRAVEYGLRVALALGCRINPTSIFARKNYFYPDLPKGYQISQYEQPLARDGAIPIQTSQGERLVRIRRVHLEEDTGKLTHVNNAGESYSLVDLNRAGVSLLEIVTEPDLHTPEDVRLYASALRSLLRYLGVNSGDMQKGVMRIEPNISVRPLGSDALGTRTEVKNLNSLRALERSVAYEIQRQVSLLRRGERIVQETVGWDDLHGVTFTQRIKETEDDYRYFPEPDLPPLALDEAWVEQVRRSLPELPHARLKRFQEQYGLSLYDAEVLVAERVTADYYEQTLAAAGGISPKVVANWISGELFALLNQSQMGIEACPVAPPALAALLQMVARGEINQNTGKSVLAEMFQSGKTAEEIVGARGLRQVSDADVIAGLVAGVLVDNPEQVTSYLKGKETVSRWLFGQVMHLAKGQANPQMVQQELDRQLALRRKESEEYH
jgi:aspartyl-tRNA(Asn)/glutamyl-tRNA(Gln) amidotransferase subunit B